MKITVVVPAHNEEKRVGKVLNSLRKKGIDVVCVDDGSTDNTWEVLVKCQKLNVKCYILRHEINLGKGAAMKTGAEYAFKNGADAVIFMDSDGQHDIKDLDLFIEKLNSKKYDVIFGTRRLEKGAPLVRSVGNKIGIVIIKLLFGIHISDLLCGFRAMTKKAFKKIDWESSGYGVETEMVAKIARYNLSYCQITVSTIYYDTVKGVTLLDAFGIFLSVIRWRLFL